MFILTLEVCISLRARFPWGPSPAPDGETAEVSRVDLDEPGPRRLSHTRLPRALPWAEAAQEETRYTGRLSEIFHRIFKNRHEIILVLKKFFLPLMNIKVMCTFFRFNSFHAYGQYRDFPAFANPWYKLFCFSGLWIQLFQLCKAGNSWILSYSSFSQKLRWITPILVDFLQPLQHRKS